MGRVGLKGTALARQPFAPFGGSPDIGFGEEINNVAAISDLISHSPRINVAVCKNYLSAAMTCVRLAWWDRKSGGVATCINENAVTNPARTQSLVGMRVFTGRLRESFIASFPLVCALPQ